MAYRQRCLVSSDEEDEDGNLTEAAPSTRNESVTTGEVIYLPDDTSNLQPEEEEAIEQKRNKQQKVSGQSLKVKSIDSLIKTSENSSTNKSQTSEKENNNTNSGNKSGTPKAPDLMPSPTGDTAVIHNNNNKKTKYSRQATPICDAIMKEYSKRQRVMKQNGSNEVSDMPIKELLEQAKSKKGDQDEEKDQESKEEKSTDPLNIVKQEIIDIKPEVLYVPIDSVNVKQEKDIPSSSSPSVKNDNINSNHSSRGRGRGRGRPARGGYQRKRKFQISDDDDTDEDPDFNPSLENMNTRRVTRSGRRIIPKYPVSDQENETSMPATSSNDNNKESDPIPNDKAINVAERLKNLAEKIADVLRKEPSPNINSEAEKLLHTTQELIEMQKKKLQEKNSENLPSGSTIKIKQEIIDTTENDKEVFSESSVKMASSGSTNSSTQHSLHIYNQLQKHEAALQKKISENVLVNATNPITPLNLPKTGNMISEHVSVQEKCTFILDFFTSYQEVFDDYTVKEAIPILASNILLCINELNDCIQRTKNADTLVSEHLKQQEIILAKQSYLKTIMGAGEKFFPRYNVIIDKIKKTKTSQVLVSTLIFYIASSLTVRAPKLKNHIHRLRRVLLFMSKAHGHYYPFITQVLQTPNDVFEGQVKLIRLMLKYFQARKFLQIPSELLGNFTHDTEGEEKQFETELSIMDTAILKRIDPFVSVVDSPSSSALNANNQTRLSNIPLELVEVIQNERDGNTKRIEQKMDYILNVLSGKGERLGNNMNSQQKGFTNPQVKIEKGLTEVRVNLGRRVSNTPTVKLSTTMQNNMESPKSSGIINYEPTSLPEDKGMLLAQLLENDHAGVDSLFSSFLSSTKPETTVRIKSEPIDIAESSDQTADISAQPVFVRIKEEPRDVLVGESGTGERNISNVNDQSLLQDGIFNDSFTEEYNFTKMEQDFVDSDPFS